MKKKLAVTAVQILIAAFILWLLFRDPGQRARMGEALRTANPLWLLAGFLLYGVVEIGAIIRWQIFLRVQDVRISWVRAGMLYTSS